MKNWIIANGQVLSNNDLCEKVLVINSLGCFTQDILPTALKNARYYDAKECLVLPALIDSHLYGVGGYSIEHDTEAGIESGLLGMVKTLPKFGIASFLPSIPASSCEHLWRTAKVCRKLMSQDLVGAEILGLYSEGMCVAYERRGAQTQNEALCSIDDFITTLFEFRDVFKIVTVAPEIPKCRKILAACKELDIIASFGHSSASYEQAKQSFNDGIIHVTHLFNAMEGMMTRESHEAPKPGASLAAIMNQAVFTEIIPDGIHVPPSLMKLLFKIKNNDKIISVSDSMQSAGTDFVGQEYFAGQMVNVGRDVATLSSGRPAASILTLDNGLRKLLKWECANSFEAAISTMTTNPARLLKLEKRGKIQNGFVADVIVMNKNYEVQATWCRGNICYSKK